MTALETRLYFIFPIELCVPKILSRIGDFLEKTHMHGGGFFCCRYLKNNMRGSSLCFLKQ